MMIVVVVPGLETMFGVAMSLQATNSKTTQTVRKS
jgi:hypothetical protein